MKQYGASTILNQLADDRASYFGDDWHDDLYSVVWNVDTARGIGLDIWGRIVVIGRELQVPESDFFGFSTAPQSWGAFGESPLYPGPGATQTVTLADDAYRVLILGKALSNIAATDSKSLNHVLHELFHGRGRAWVNDLGGMNIRFVFEFALEPWEKAVLTGGRVLPRPSGVGATLAEIPPDTFGFAEAGDCEPFGQGTMLNSGAITNVD